MVTKECKVILEPLTPKVQLALSAELRNVINEKNLFTARTKKKFITALDDLQDEDDTTNTKLSIKEQAIEEIFNTEVTYLNQLETIMEYFMEPLEKRRIITEEDFECIFNSISTIYDVNGALLEELKTDTTKIAQVFTKLAPFLKLYSVYAYNYSKAINRIQDLTKHNHVFTKFLQNQESRPEVQTKLISLLITPIQRVPRYLLLVRQVLENTSPGDSDYEALQECTEKLQETANHINKKLDEQENMQSLLDLQQSLNKPNLIEPSRKLLKEGKMMKAFCKDGHSKECYMVLMSDIIMWCKIKKSNIKLPKSLECSAILPLHKIKVKFHPDTRYINIIHDKKDYVFYHRSEDENEKWFEAISETISKVMDNRKTLRKQSSAKKAVFKKEVKQYHSEGLSPGRTRRKRKISEQSPVVSESSNHIEIDPSADQNRFISHRILKRRTISRDRTIEPPSKKTVTFETPMESQKDILYPLRKHVHQNGESSSNVPTAPNINIGKTNDVYVFGDPTKQNNTGFRFRVINFFTGLKNFIFRR